MKDLQSIVTNNSSFVIFAAQPHEPHTVMEFMRQNNIQFKVLLGQYNGVVETSYCVPADQFTLISLAGIVDDQESLLILGPYQESGMRKASILFIQDSSIKEVGEFVQITKEESSNFQGWTFDPMGSTYFTIMQEADAE